MLLYLNLKCTTLLELFYSRDYPLCNSCPFVMTSSPGQTSLPGACLITDGGQIIDQGYPGALSRFTLDFLLLYAFLPALVLLGVISYKIRDHLVRN